MTLEAYPGLTPALSSRPPIDTRYQVLEKHPDWSDVKQTACYRARRRLRPIVA